MEDLPTEDARRRAIAWATALTAGTPLAPQQYEAALLERYARGQLSLDQVLQQLDGRVHHVLYRSQATRPFTEAQLWELCERAQDWNAQHGLTGLLCYCPDGHFAQVFEGAADDVQDLLGRIQADPRHRDVHVLSHAAGPARLFPDWRMAFALAEPAEFYWLVGYLEARQQRLLKPQFPITGEHLRTLVTAFSQL
jgi:hypothetical protein